MTISRLRAGLQGAVARAYQGDWDVSRDGGPDATAVLVPAAVLIAVSDEAEPQLVLTRRPTTMARHPGQIAFPGGRVDPAQDIFRVESVPMPAAADAAPQMLAGLA